MVFFRSTLLQFNTLKFSPVTEKNIEEHIIKLAEARTKGNYKSLKLNDILYIQPNEIDLVDSLTDLGADKTVMDAKVNMELESKTIDELNPQKKPAPKMDIASLNPEPKPEAPAKVKEEDKAISVEYKHERATGDLDAQVMSALQNTHPKNRAKAPEEFFIGYSDSNVCIPVFLVYLFIIVLMKTYGSIFS